MATVAVLGPVEVRVGEHVLGPGDFGGSKPKQLFEVLVLARGRPVTKDRLADALWGENMPQNVAATLESYVSVLRRRLGRDGLIETRPGAYRLNTDEARVDLDRFDELLALAAGSGPRAARRHLREALALVRGELMEDEPYADWAERERDTHRGRTVQARLDAAEAALACRDADAGFAHAERALEEDPLNERAYRLLMLSAYLMGRQDTALRTFDRCRQMFEEELGVEPMGETVDLYHRMREHSPASDLLPPPCWDGLPRATEMYWADAPFVSRDAELAELRSCFADALAGSYRLVLVEGGLGMGKTRLLHMATEGVAVARIGRATCSRVEQDLPFVPLAMALKAALPPDAPDPLTRVLPELDPQRGETGRVRALEAITDMVASAGPMVLGLDDVHWADAQTLTALSYLRHRCATSPLVIVAAFDPAAVGPGHILTSLRPDHRLRLGPLPHGAVDAVGGPGTFARTAGHPLLLAALTDAEALGSEEVLSLRVGWWVVEQSETAGAHAHQLLVTAAVLGRPFVVEDLTPVVRGDPVELAEELDRLCSLGLLKVEGGRLAFRYPVVAEALRKSVSPAREHLLRRLLGLPDRGVIGRRPPPVPHPVSQNVGDAQRGQSAATRSLQDAV